MSKTAFKSFLKNHKVTSDLSPAKIELLAGDLTKFHRDLKKPRGGIGPKACSLRPSQGGCVPC